MTMALRRRVNRPVAFLVAALMLFACTAENEPDQPTESAPEPVDTAPDLSGSEDVTLVVWQQDGHDGALDELDGEFMAAHPGITVERHDYAPDELADAFAEVTGDEAPDVVQLANTGEQLGSYTAAGDLLELDEYAEMYDWPGRLGESVLRFSRVDSADASIGHGELYGLPRTSEMIGIYYRPATLAELDLDVPETWAGFLEQLTTIRDTEQTPLILGNADRWPAVHLFGPVHAAWVSGDEASVLGFGLPGAAWTDSANQEAAATVQEWGVSGYLNDDAAELSYDEAWRNFVAGDGVYLIAGSWLADQIAAQDEEIAFMAPPPTDEAAGPVTTGAPGPPFAITTSSQHPDVAAAYLDFLTGDEAAQMVDAGESLPATSRNSENTENNDDADVDDLRGDVLSAYRQVALEGTLVPYLDRATPTMGETLEPALHGLLDGDLTVEEFADVVDADYAGFLAERH